MEIIDYNGDGRWSLQSVRERYATYAAKFRIAQPRDLIATHHRSGDTLWIYSVIEAVIEGIAAGDPACVELGIDYIEEDQGFAFGRILKSNAARALRRAQLSDEQKERIRGRVIHIWLHWPRYPREFRQYRNLLRTVGLGRWWRYVEDPLTAPTATRCGSTITF